MEAGTDVDVCTKWSETLRVYHNTSCELENELQARHELGLSEFEVLLILGRTCGDQAGGKAKMKDIEAEMYLSQSALSRTVTRLEKAGLVTRAACDFDRGPAPAAACSARLDRRARRREGRHADRPRRERQCRRPRRAAPGRLL